MLKTLAFLFIFLYLIPFLTVLSCMFPTLRHVFFAGMLFFTCWEITLNILPLPQWRGTARGYAFSAVSLFATPLLLSMSLSFKYKVKLFPPGSFFYFLYFLAVLLSGINAIHRRQWGFEVYKMVWMYITFLAAFNYMNHCRDLKHVIILICFILIYIFLVGLNQKYRQGLYQIRSSFPHQNSLSLYLEFFGLLVLGVLMNEKMGKFLFTLCLMAFGSSTVMILFTYSRGGMVMYFAGVAMVCMLSIVLNGFSVRRLTLMLIGMIVMMCLVGYALPRIIERFNKAPEASKNTRVNLAIASKRMANDFKLGVGANNYSEYSGPFRNYTKEQFARVSTTFLDTASWYGGIVETIYLLVAAECGWWGLGVLLLWFFYYYFSDLISMLMLRKYPCSGITIGLFGGMTVVYTHSILEWSLKQYNNFAQQMFIYALIGVIAVNRKNIRAAYRHSMLAPQSVPPAPVQPPPLPPESEPGPELPPESGTEPELPPESGTEPELPPPPSHEELPGTDVPAPAST